MNVQQFVADLEIQDFYLAVEDDKLILRGKKNGAGNSKPTPEIISYIRENKEALKQYLAESQGGRREQENITAIYRLSALQEGLLFHSLYDGSAYTEQFVCRLNALDPSAFQRSWDLLLRRHSILRTGFYVDTFNIPVQCVYRQAEMPLQMVDFRHLDEEARAAAIEAHKAADRLLPFDLRQAPLMRTSLLRLENSDYCMLWTYHHLVIDGWSMQILIREFLEVYEGFVTGAGVADIAEDRYEEYIRYIERHGKPKEEQYWRQYMQGLEEATLLPFIPASVQRNKGQEKYSSVDLVLDEETTQQLQAYAQAQHVTVNTLIQATWSCLLHRYTGQDDVTFGVTVSGRPEDLPGMETRIGLYINMIPLHAQWTPETPLGDWLRAMQKGQQLSRRFQYTSINDIQRWIGIPGDLFDTTLTFQNFPVSEVVAARPWQLSIASLEVNEQSTNYPLSLRALLGAGTVVQFIYKPSVLPVAVVESISRHFRNVLMQIIGGGSILLGDLRLLRAVEERQLVDDPGRGPAPLPDPAGSVLDLFARQVLNTPGAPALEMNGQTLSYRDLDEQSSRLAAYLQTQTSMHDALVPICLYRSTEFAVAILAVLKAGGAYVPVDPDYPADRIAYMLADTAAPLVISHGNCAAALPAGMPTILLDAVAEEIAATPLLQRDHKPAASALAYVIYTSGSTGKPKGVLINHGGLLASTLARRDYYGPTGTALLVPSFSFDSSVAVFFGTLCTGGRLLLCSADQLKDTAFVAPLLARAETILCVPSYYRFLADEELLAGSALMRVILAGEQLDQALVDKHERALPQAALYNEYGPTENTVWATVAQVRHGASSVTIGKPVAGVTLYVLDRHGVLVPPGVPGELCIGGPQVAPGYLNRAALTREKFIHLPFAEGRVYRTGDLVRWQAGGELEFLGRTDDQVKIRGFRVELGEIAAALQQAPGIRQAVVTAPEEAGSRRLLAFVVTDENWDREQVLASLRASLPDYMIPLLVRLDSIPLTPNGKVDKKRLPLSALEEAQAYVAPRNTQEEQLCAIWQELLGVQRVGIHDNFFELGGHSLLAMRLVAVVRKQLGHELSIREVFAHPTVAALSAQLEHVSAPVVRRLVKSARSGNIPLSFAQERLWFVGRMQGSLPYQLSWVFRCTGLLDAVALEDAFRSIVQRHEVLRTVIREEGGAGWQEVRSGDDWKMQQVRGADAVASDGTVNEYVGRLLQTPFDLSADPMLQVTLIGLSADEHLLVTRVHHIAFDGWSIGILVRELVEFYRSRQEGRAAVLPALEVQYGDYALWQRAYLSGVVLEEKLSYWRRQLEGVQPLALVLDHPRPARQSMRGDYARKTIDAATADALVRLGQQEGATLFMVLLAAFKVLLWRYSGQGDICVGTPVAGRQQQEVEGLIGFFINTLPLRAQLRAEDSFRALLREVRRVTLDGYEHQELPFEKIVEALGVERDMSRHPLFQVVLALHNMPESEALDLGAVSLRSETPMKQVALYDLDLDAVQWPGGIYLSLTYCTDLFSADTAALLLDHFEALLVSVAAQADVSLDSLTLLPAAEVEKINGFNKTHAAYPENKTVVDLFEEQVLATPTAPALVFEGEELSYQALDERSNQLAHYLKEKGVQEEQLVPLCLERSSELIITILALLKLGAAYVPIDPSYPEARIRYMLQDCGGDFILTSSDVVLEEGIGRININEKNIYIKSLPVTKPVCSIKASSLAYLMYTSGSTGTPKGVMVEHRNIVSLVKGSGFIELHESDVLLSTGSPSFDATTIEYWGALLNGAKLVMARQDDLLDAAKLRQIIIEQGVTTMWFTAGWFNQLVETDPALFASLKKVMVGGDRLSPRHVDQLRKLYPHLVLINGYGPTENTTFSLTHTIEQTDGMTDIPIGRPLNNRTAYILDEAQRLCPIGVRGELYVGGAGLARGYWKDEARTEEKFSDISGLGRLYRTGDLARWTADGIVEFFGRADDQVKIRGYRIELGEIETALQNVEGIKEAVVVVQEEEQGKRLIAYVVAGSDYEQETVLHQLHASLPEYMVPSAIIEVAEIPLTSNGKVDRKKLLESFTLPASTKTYVAPRNEIEQALANIWQELLDVEQIGIHDNFFELGGHSLLAIRLLSAIRSELGAEVAIKDIFECASLAVLAEQIAADGQATSLLPVIPKADRGGRLPLSYGQERLWFIDQLQGSLHYHMPWVFRLEGLLNISALEAAFRGVIGRHEVLRTVIREEEGIGYQSINDVGNWHIDLVTAEEIRQTGEELDAYLQRWMSRPYDLSRDAMLQVLVVCISEEEHLLATLVHHIAFDGWSIGIVVRELSELYKSSVENRSAQLPALPIQYADYAVWQRSYLSGERLEQKLDYWKTQLTGVAPLELKADSQQGAVSVDGAAVQLAIEGPLLQQLNTLAQRESATLFMVLLAAFKVLLQRYTGQSDICVGTPIAGRQQKEVEGLVGFFINTLVLRSHLAAHRSFDDLLHDVRLMTLKAYEHQDVPFEKIVEALGLERDRRRNPLFQVLFTLQNMPDGGNLDLGGVRLLNEPLRRMTAQFDLNLNVVQSDRGLYMNLIYRTGFYEEATALRMLAHYELLLHAIATSSHTLLQELPLLDTQESLRLHRFGQGALAADGGEDTLLSLFAQRVAATPANAALVFGDDTLSYRQLDEHTNRLARHLTQMGVKPGDLVALCLSPSLELLPSLLAILKTGAAYLPIDPTYPEGRIAYLLEDSEAVLTLTTAAHEHLFDSDQRALLIDEVNLDGYSSEALPMVVDKDQLAYVLYTSGSTGKPKGVLITHHSLISYLINAKNNYINNNYENASGAYAHLSYTFDASLTALFTPLISGKAVVMSSATGAGVFEDPALLANAPYDFIKLTPAHLALLQALLGAEGLARLTKRLVIGGEALRQSQLDYLHQQHIEVVNEYGPTEATVGCSTYSFYTDEEYVHEAGSISIGRPMAGVRLFVLDAHQQLAPIGVPGELCIGGDQLAKGYLKLEALTKTRFVELEGIGRVYKTGDKARWTNKGLLEFMGRMDEQVKLRGYRIELLEIEEALKGIGTISEAVVLVQQEEERLIAFVVTQAEYDGEEVKRTLRSSLPEYMVPTAIIEVDQIPLTTNGKVDKRRLLESFILPASTSTYVAPRNEVEQALANIWQELLEVETVGIHDNFFQLGGHSLLAIRLIAAIRSTLGKEIAIKDVFEYSTVGQMAELIDAEKQAAVLLPSITPADRDQRLPLSFAQERLWFIDRLQGSVQYHMPWVFHLSGTLNIEALESSFKELIQRHEVLRTVILEEEGIGYQIVTDAVDWHMTVVKEEDVLRTHGSRQEFISRTVVEPYDLSNDTILRVVLIELAADEYVLVTLVHHIAFDGWSIRIVVRELTELYESRIENRSAQLPALPIQYADYAAWQRNYLSGERLEQALAYWREQLQDIESLNLTTDRPRSPLPDPRSARVNAAVSTEVHQALLQLAQSEGATLFMVLLAGFQTLLYRHTGQSDICVGTPIAGRRQQEVEGLIGFFINTLALRSRVQGNEKFKELLQSVRTMTLDAYTHQDMPFEKLVDALGVARDMSRNPLFQVMFVLQNMPGGEGLRLGDLELTAESSGVFNSPFELGLEATEMPEGIHLSFSYRLDLFEPDTIERLLGHYLELLTAIAAGHKAAVDHLPLLPAQELLLVRDAWNSTDHSFEPAHSLLSAFEEQAALHPQAIALVSEDASLTYQQLDQYSNQLAHYLAARGVTKETLVPICLDRSPRMVIAILATWKAGGAYVPIDPEYPLERIRYMLEDSGGTHLITTGNYRKLLGETDAQLICLDEEAQLIAQESIVSAGLLPTPQQLAYVIYTSGSTGRPKGVMNEHGGIANRLLWGQEHFNLGREETVMQKTTFCFDISIWELFWPLMQGARLVLARPGGQRDPLYVKSLVEQTGITTIHFVPSMLQLFLEVLEPGDCPSLRRILCSGEALQPVHFAGMEAKLPQAALFNLYGPTEAAIEVTCWQKPAGTVTRVPIGAPVANTRLYVLSAAGALCGIGVPGELHIGGTQVARGYHHQPELTQTKFISDPFTNTGRLYRTGDKARWLPDGTIEFLGRLDDQVKLRGYRIELGEIESALLQSAQVEQAVVLLHKGGEAEARIVAYIVGENINKKLIIEEVGAKLPQYMVPSVLVEVEAIPLTANGKVDRAALLRVALDGAEAVAYEAPRTDTEQLLAALWEELLHIEQPGIHDNFFARGGHSLLAMRLVAAIRKRTGRELAIRSVFQYPTIATLATVLESLPVSFMPAFMKERPARLPLSFAQERLWFIDRLQGSTHYHMPWVLRLTGSVDVTALQQAFGTIIDRHEILRTVIREADGAGYQHVETGGAFSLQQIHREMLPPGDEALREYITQVVEQPFDLAHDLLLRATLIRLEEDAHLLVVVVHHIAFDGWSTGILARELSVAYNEYIAGRSPALPAMPIQYADYALWQRDYLSGDVLDRKLAYWKQQLEGVQPLDLPTDHPRPAQQSTRGAVVQHFAGSDLMQPLQELSQSEGGTLFMTLLAAFNVLLYRYSGQADICIGTPVAGRQQQEVEGLIGFFVNSLVLRTKVDGTSSFRDVLRTVRQTTLDAYDHQELPFEKIVEALDVARDQSRNPLFQVMFTMQHVSGDSGLELAGLEISAEGDAAPSAKFDLSLNIATTAEGLYLSLTYSLDLFEPSTIERLLGHYLELLTAIAAGHKAAVDHLPLLPAQELLLVRDAWNSTDHSFPAHSLLSAFEEQAALHPEAIALVSEETSLTYQQLDQYSNQLAHYLAARGVTKETLVPICLDRSPRMVIAILATWKAGGAYVPIDAEYPLERIRYMLEDSGGTHLITTGNYRTLLGETDAQLICLDEEAQLIAQESIVSTGILPTPQQLAYVIYTSGSTGRPKGVMNEHGGIANRLLWGQKHFNLGREEAVMQKTTFCFDISIWELFWPLMQGARLVLARPGGQRDPLYVKSLVEQTDITTIHFVPSMLQLFLEALEPGDCPGLRRILCSGEALQPVHFADIQTKLPQAALFNLYGPTEAAIEVTCWQKPAGAVTRVPIGAPVANTRLYVLSAAGALCGIGVPGELYIGGAQVARGYHHQPELTQTKFISDPFTNTGRLYRTGDKARWLPDGTIEFLGRLDDQVKLRGYRIELGEIESALLQSAQVEQTVVLLYKGGEAEARIVAYIVGENIDKKLIIEEVGAKLPQYMLPSAVVDVEAIPLTANGKVDRAALLRLALNGAEAVAYEAPRTDTEQLLATLWQELLHIEQPGIHDNFFARGGHSLLMIRLLSCLRENGLHLQLRDLFVHQTIAAQAAAMARPQAPVLTRLGRKKQHVLHLNDVVKGQPIFVMPGSIGVSDSYDELAQAFDSPVYGLQMQGLYKGEQPLLTIPAIARQHIRWMRTVQPRGPYRLIGHSFGGHVAFETCRQLEAEGDTVQWVAILDIGTTLGAAITETNKLQVVLENAFDVFGANPALRTAYDSWGDALETELKDLPITAMVPAMRRFKKQGQSSADLDFLFNALNLRLHNLLVRHEATGRVDAPLVIAVAAENSSDADGGAGWSDAGATVHHLTLPGHHFSMCRGAGPGVLAAYVQSRLNVKPVRIL